MNYYYTTTSI